MRRLMSCFKIGPSLSWLEDSVSPDGLLDSLTIQTKAYMRESTDCFRLASAQCSTETLAVTCRISIAIMRAYSSRYRDLGIRSWIAQILLRTA